MAKLLVADDDPAVLDILARFLSASGHEVLRAKDGAEARALFDSDAIDLVVTDLEMPVLGGIDLLAHVRGSPRPVPVIMVSGNWGHGQRQQARDLGADRVYPKPVDFGQILRDIEDLLP